MTQEEMREYQRDYKKGYRQEGFGRLCDKRYYLKHRDSILKKQRMRDKARAISRKKLRKICDNEE